jgi:ubiquinone biosynthesis accessory factor UbiK
MTTPNLLKNLVKQLSEALPEHFNAFKSDFEKNCGKVLASAFDKLDLVTREEFDTQSKVLLRTRKKLEELEKQLRAYENALKRKHSSK